MSHKTSITEESADGSHSRSRFEQRQRLAFWLDHLAWWVFPRRCPSCGTTLDPSQTFCPTCITALHPIKEPLCPVCFLPFHAGPNHICGRCIADPPPFERAVAIFEYGGSAAQAVKRLKYGRALDAAKALGRIMAHHLSALEPDLICPVPLHPRRLRDRGFNQAMELARHAARAAGLPGPKSLLKRVGDPEPQAAKTLAQRRKLGSGRFVLTKKRDFHESRIVLVDDVITTQATVRAAARTLVAAGATVSVLALARTPL